MSKRGYNKKLECFILCTIFLIKSLHLNTILINIEKFACLKKAVKYFFVPFNMSLYGTCFLYSEAIILSSILMS